MTLACLVLPSLLFLRPAQAQYGGWSAVPCDDAGTLNAPTLGTETGYTTDTYPPVIAAAGSYGFYPSFPNASSYTRSVYNGTIGIDSPDSAAAFNYYGNYYGTFYTTDASHNSVSVPVNGSVTADWNGQVPFYFKEVWQGSGTPTTLMPDHIDFLLRTNVAARASVSYGTSGLTSGLSATAVASDGSPFNETAVASAGDAGAGSGPASVLGVHLIRVGVDPNTHIATVSLSGTTHWVASNSVPYTVPSPGGSVPPKSNGPTSASASSYVSVGISQDSREVRILAPIGQTYHKGVAALQEANIPDSNGTLADDTIAPAYGSSRLISHVGAATGAWGANSSYVWSQSFSGYNVDLAASADPGTKSGILVQSSSSPGLKVAPASKVTYSRQVDLYGTDTSNIHLE